MYSGAYVAADVDHLCLNDTGSAVGLAQTFPRYMTGANLSVLSTQQMFMCAIDVRAPMTVTNVSFLSGLTGASVPANWWFALYTSARVLLAQTADQTSTAWAASTLMTKALQTAQRIQPGLYYLALMMKATIVPTLEGIADTTVLSGATPILHGTADGGLTNLAPSTAGTITATVNYPYAFVS